MEEGVKVSRASLQVGINYNTGKQIIKRYRLSGVIDDSRFRHVKESSRSSVSTEPISPLTIRSTSKAI